MNHDETDIRCRLCGEQVAHGIFRTCYPCVRRLIVNDERRRIGYDNLRRSYELWPAERK